MGMRIGPENLEHYLAGLHGGRQVLAGVIQRITSASVFLRSGQVEAELPLAAISAELRDALREGLLVELHREQGVLVLKVVTAVQEPAGREQPVRAPQTLEEALLALDIRPSGEAQLAAKALLEAGLPLQKDFLRVLLPWAERGRLEEALQLLQTGFPVTAELVELAGELSERPADQAVPAEIAPELPEELEEALRYPSLRSRSAVNGRQAEGRVFRALARLLAEEKLLTALIPSNRGGEEREFIFFLPFLRGEDLHAAWVRVGREGEESPEDEREKSFRLELLLPTDAFGLVRAELFVQGQKVRLHLAAERGEESLSGQADELRAELLEAGWQLSEVKVGELEQCAKPSLYAMIAR
jgi:hypothetical protein